MRTAGLSPRSRFAALVVALLLAAAHNLHAQTEPAYPQWWYNQGLISGTAYNDFAAANQGEAKNFAVGAVNELDTDLAQFGGAGGYLPMLSGSLVASESNGTAMDYAAINLGQLKWLLQPFYDQLLSVGYTLGPLSSGTYPWANNGLSASDFSAANIGQLKYLFDFDLTYSTAGDRIPDWWVKAYFGTGSTFDGVFGVDPNLDPNGEGFTTLDDYLYAMNPDANIVVSVGPCVGEYPFGELTTTGTTAYDLSSLHNNGRLSGGAGWDRDNLGYDGDGAVTFNGTTAAVLISNTGSRVLRAAGAPFSLALWFEPSISLSGTTALVAAGTPGVSGFELGVDSTVSPPNLVFTTPGGGGVQLATPIQPGVWSQAAVTYDGTNFTMYVDGLPEVTATGTLVSSTSTITLGNGPAGVRPFFGQMENVRFYQASLQETDISSLYNLSTTGDYGVDPSGLANYWKYEYFRTLSVNPNAFVAWSGTTVTVLQAFYEGLNPIDFYNGAAPTLSIVSGSNQIGPPGGFVPAPLVVSVTDSNGNAIVGAPVSFSVTSGTLQASSGGKPGTSILAFTDQNGFAQMYYQLPPAISSTTQVTVTTGTGVTYQEVAFGASSDDGTGAFLSPFAPSDCMGVVNGDGNLILSWTNNTDNETAIYIEQQQSDGTWAEVASVGPGVTTYTVAPPTPGAYRIDAQLPAGDPASKSVFVQTPTLNYVPIAISGTYSSNVAAVGLDDNNNAAFTFTSGDATIAGLGFDWFKQFNTYIWQSGAVGSDMVTSGTVEGEISSGGTSWWLRGAGAPAAIVTSAGNLYGSEAECNVDNSGTEIFTEGVAAGIFDGTEDIDNPSAAFENPVSGGGCFFTDVSANGIIAGSADLSDTNNQLHAFYFIRQPTGSYRVFDTSSYSGLSDPNLTVTATNFTIVAVNSNGWAVGTDGNSNGLVWTGTSFGSPSLAVIAYPTAISDSGQVVGADASGTAGYLWTSSATHSACPEVVSGVQSIYSLIPPPYQGNIQSIWPIDISSANATDGSVRILFSGDYITDPEGDTSNGLFLLTLTSGTSSITSGTAETIFQQVCLPPGMSSTNIMQSGMINSQGTIAVLGSTPWNSGTSAILLFPIILKNLGDPTERNGANYKDSQISFVQPLPSGTDTNINSVAWIAASDTTQPIVVNGVYPPRMPKFVASSGSISGLTYCWKLQVTFHDRFNNPHRDFDLGDPNCSNTSAQIMTDPIVTPSALTSDTPDQVTIPAAAASNPTDVTTWHQITGGSPWNIYEDPAWTAAVTGTEGFFGGDAVLSLEILSGTNVVAPEQDYDFRIAGENPTKATAEAFLTGTYGGKSASQALTTNPHAWFAWAIAKDETAGEGSGGYYNHFLTNGGNPLTSKGTPSNKSQPWPGHEGRPNWNDDGTYQEWNKTHTKRVGRWTGSGGYGLFQLTYASRNNSGNTADANYIMPRGWIWNWQSNGSAFNTEFQTEVTSGTNFYNLLVANYPHNGPIQNQDSFSAVDAIIVTEYNGMSGGSHPSPGQIASWKTKSNWVLLNGTLQPSCWIPLRQGWQFLQNGNNYERNVNGILIKP